MAQCPACQVELDGSERTCPACGAKLCNTDAPTRLVVTGGTEPPGRVLSRAVHLVVVLGRTRVAEHRFERGTIGIGRDSVQDVVLDNPGVSRRHCQLRFEPRTGVFVLEDLGSPNGTLVNGRQVLTLAELAPGDEIGLGKLSLLFNPSSAQLAGLEARPGSAAAATQQQDASTTYLDQRELDRVRDEMAGKRAAHLRQIGGAAGHHPLDRPSTLLGRSPAADIPLQGWLIAARHAVVIRLKEQRYVIRPVGGLRRVRVNGRPVRGERILGSHDRIAIGRNVFQFFPAV